MKHLSFSSDQIVLGLSTLGLFLLPFFHVSPLVHSAVLIFCFLLQASFIGTRWFSVHHRGTHLFLGAFLLVALSSILQTIWYYSGYLLGPMSDAWTLGGSILLFHLLPVPAPAETTSLEEKPLVRFFTQASWIIPLLIAAEIAVCFIILQAVRAQTLNAVNTPWALLPAGTLAAFAILAGSIWLSVQRKPHANITLIFTLTFLLAVSLLTCLVYPLGFGFDGFLHRASESLLLTTGTLHPKPPYYIGQYVFTTWLTRILELKLFWVDVLLVPLSVTILPLSLLLRHRKKTTALFLVGIPLFLPLSLFITTTPQAFSYLIGLLGLFFGLAALEQRVPWLLVFLSSVWSLSIHPLSGLPFFGASLLLYWNQYLLRRSTHSPAKTLIRSPIWWILLIGTSFVTPVAFFLNGLVSRNSIQWNFSALGHISFYQEIIQQWFAVPTLHFVLFVDWTNFFQFLLPFLGVFCAIWAIWKDPERRAIWISLCLLSIGTCLAGIFLKASGDFSFLIEYERGNYADRLFVIAHLILLPVSLQGFALWIERLFKRPPLLRFAFGLFFIAAVSANVYQAFPRHDAGIVGHGWSVGQADIDVVRFIDKDAQGQPYTVLANQSVSAAAISQYGFKRYVDDIFYYPIPTGGPLYTTFLEAMRQPDRQVIQEAAHMGHSDLVYVVINSYWNNASALVEKYKSLADKSWSVYDGKIYLFQFHFNPSANAAK